MRALLDTCVLSELNRKGGSSQVRTAVDALEDEDLYISAITVGELTKGVLRLPPGKRRSELTTWLLALRQHYSGRILAVDEDTAELWGEIAAHAEARGKIIPALDGLIAATAMQHGLHILTRNTDDFLATGAMLSNPWES
ncbi:type II toxin-antitoxin system VapC family toxin [Acidicapsa dinghuensis]|uniref:Ribonuclease VapC n=1 Tax=Acidicapsa dinghuensis TaxID=2218256 RepID=A0ABW1EBW0_9BACT|nr:type II toxin-antitoxin system VapC family toxin [Acidicapsa dinghuensis]